MKRRTLATMAAARTYMPANSAPSAYCVKANSSGYCLQYRSPSPSGRSCGPYPAAQQATPQKRSVAGG